MSILEDGERMQWDNNGILMECLKQSKTISGRLTLLTSKATVVQVTSDVQLPTLDGGSYSDIEATMLSMREER
jgi:hypothetical protein